MSGLEAPKRASRSHRVVRRGALAYEMDGGDIWWSRRRVVLSATERAIMAQLIRRGRSSYVEIGECIGARGMNAKNLSVFLWRIKGKFAELGAATPFRRVSPWGLELVVEPDDRGSTSLWVGGSLADGATDRATERRAA